MIDCKIQQKITDNLFNKNPVEKFHNRDKTDFFECRKCGTISQLRQKIKKFCRNC